MAVCEDWYWIRELRGCLSLWIRRSRHLFSSVHPMRACLSTRTYCFPVYPVLVEVQNVEFIVVVHDSAMGNNIPILLIAHSHMCILYKREGTRLSTQAYYPSADPVSLVVKNIKLIVVLHGFVLKSYMLIVLIVLIVHSHLCILYEGV
jgi:hypothetical protein